MRQRTLPEPSTEVNGDVDPRGPRGISLSRTRSARASSTESTSERHHTRHKLTSRTHVAGGATDTTALFGTTSARNDA